MRHYRLTDSDLAGLRVAGADDFPLTLMRLDRGQPKLSDEGWGALSAELESLLPDVVLVDPLVALMGGVSLNDNSAAALMLSNFVRLAARRGLALVIAHHAAKNREATSAEAAMGAASLVNLARIVLSIEPLAESDAGKIGVAPWDARSVFRIISTKQNLSPPNAADRWFRLVSVDMPNAEPPIYPHGDRVAVVEPFAPNPGGAVFPLPLITAALQAIAGANPPLSPSGRGTINAISVIAQAIAPHRGHNGSKVEAKAVLDHLLRSGRVAIQDVQVPRQGRGPYTRKGVAVIHTQASTGLKP
jgi:hypothetical protein